MAAASSLTRAELAALSDEEISRLFDGLRPPDAVTTFLETARDMVSIFDGHNESDGFVGGSIQWTQDLDIGPSWTYLLRDWIGYFAKLYNITEYSVDKVGNGKTRIYVRVRATKPGD